MPKNIVDHDHRAPDATGPFSRIERIEAGEAGHPRIRMLNKRRHKGLVNRVRLLQFLRIERGSRSRSE